MQKRLSLFFVVLFAAPWIAVAQTQDSTLLTLDRIFASREFMGERFGPAKWLEDGTAYTTLERSPDVKGARDIVRYETATGAKSILVSASRLIPKGDTTALDIDNYSWSPDGKMLMVYTNSKRVWRQNTRGDYWVLDLKTDALRKLGGDAEPSTLMFAKFSPDNKKVAYVREHNLYVEDLATGAITQLTFDGSRTIINGTFDWVYEEEFDDRDGFRWSPDSKWISYWQLDADGVRDFLLINDTDSLYSYTIPVQYPKAGTTNSACRVGVVSAAGGTTRWFDVPGDPRNNYIPRMDWAESSDQIVVQHMNRLQNTNEVMLGDVATGKVKTVLTDRDKAWLDVVDDLRWFDKGRYFTWVSESEGWRHVYLYTRDGKRVRDITPGSFDVIETAGIDKKGEWLYYIASPDNPTQRYLYRTRIDGKGKAQRLSPADQPGTHNYSVSPDAKWAFHIYSSFAEPTVIDLIGLPDHQRVRVLAGNDELRAKITSLKRGPMEFFRVDAGDGVKLDGWMMKPYNFDPSKKYPLLVYVYGEPAAQTVVDRWGGRNYLWHLLLTQQGYLVASIDNRGTPAPRGRDWRKVVYRNVLTVASKDEAGGVRAIRSWPYVDTTRVGIWGWSGGGSSTLHAMFRYPDLYQTGMAVAPVSDERYYDTIYEERYMGLPQDNVDGYREGSAITYAADLKGNLLIVHGSGDDNVHYQNTEAVVNAMIKANRHFTMMVYPNRSHGIFEGQNTTRHLFELLTWYLNTNLPAGGR